METSRCKKIGANDKLLEKVRQNQECINNHYSCKFNQDGVCGCERKDVGLILESLQEFGALKKTKLGRYVYNFDFMRV